MQNLLLTKRRAKVVSISDQQPIKEEDPNTMPTATAVKHHRHQARLDAEIAEALANEETLLELTADQAAKAIALAQVRAELAKLRKEEAAMSAELKAALKGHSGATLLGKLVLSISKRAGARHVDYDRFAAEHPKIYAKMVSRGAEVDVLHVHR
jgi:hypothetical protein